MPHIVLEGPVDLKKFYTDYQPVSRQKEGEVLKLQDIFINPDSDTLLIEALAVEDGPPNRFFVQEAIFSGVDMIFPVPKLNDQAAVRKYCNTSSTCPSPGGISLQGWADFSVSVSDH